MRSNRLTRTLSRTVCLLLAATIAGAAIGATSPGRPANAAGDITALVLDGEPGDQVSRGRSITRSGTDFERVSADVRDPELPGGVRLHYTDVDGRDWRAMIRAPEGAPLVPGTYTNATNGGNIEPGQPELIVEGDGRYCYLTKGSFTVHEIETDWYDLLSFSVSFKQLCNNSTGWLYGEIRYKASGGYKAAEMLSSGLDFDRLEVNERSATESVVVTSAGTSALHLGVAQLVGDDAASFRIESDSCSDATLAPDESCSIGVSAMPLSTRAVSAKVTIPDDTFRGKKAITLDATGFREYEWGSVGTAGRNYTWTGGESLAYTEGEADRLQQVNVSPRINGKWAKDGGPWIGVFHSRKGVAESRWSTVKRINQKTMHGIQPAIAASGDAVYAVWVGTKKYVPYQPRAPRVLYFRANRKGGRADSWRSIKRLTSKTGRVDSPTIAADGSNVYVVWTNSNSGKIWLAMSRDRGVTWAKRQVATTSSKGASGYDGHPVIAADQDHLIVAWWPRRDATLKAKTSTDGGRTWSAATKLGYSTWQPAVAANDGRLAVAWPHWKDLFVRTWEGGWQPQQEIDTGSRKTFTPAIVLRGSDAMAIAYPLCLRNCTFEPDAPKTKVSLKWRYSADRGKAWTSPTGLAGSSYGRNVNDQPSMVWPDGGRRAVLFDGWVPYSNKYRVYLVQGPTIDPSSAGFRPEASDLAETAEPMPRYHDRGLADRRRE